MGRRFAGLAFIALAAGCSAPPEADQPAAAPTARAAASAPAPPPADSLDRKEKWAALLGQGEAPEPGGTVLRHLEADCNSLNPVLTSHLYEDYMCRYIFEPLYDYDRDVKLTPVLAEGMPEVSADKLVHTVHLKSGITWQDGQPFTADDVKFTVDMTIHPDVPAINKKSYFDQLARIEVVDPRTVRFVWKVPFAPAFHSYTSVFVIPRHLYEVKEIATFAKQERNRNPVGTGPYRFEEWKTGQYVTLVPNPGYWGPKPRLDKIIGKVIESREVALKACQSGELDEQRVPIPQWFSEAARPDFTREFNRVTYDWPNYNMIGWNCRSPRFGDKRVRRAMALAFNVEAIIRDLYRGLAHGISGPYTYGTDWYDDSIAPLPYDLEQASKLLEEAGWKDTNGDGVRDKAGTKFAFELLYPSGNSISEQSGAIFQESLKKLGVVMDLRPLEGASFFDKFNKGEYEACTLAWSFGVDPEERYSIFHSSMTPPLGSNSGFYSNPEVDRLLAASRSEFDHARRVEIVHQIQRILAEDQPELFMLSTPDRRVFRRTIRGIEIGPLGPFLITPGASSWWIGRGPGAAR